MSLSFIIKRSNPDVPTEGLVGWWKMDSASGPGMLDYSGNANTLDLISGTPSVVTGLDGNALRFDGEVAGKAASNFGITNANAISMFVKFNAVTADNAYYSLLSFSGVGADKGIGLVRTYGAFRVHMCLDSGSVMEVNRYNTAASGHTPSINTWYHYFMQYNTATSNVELWVDVVKVVDETWLSFGSFNQGNGVQISSNATYCDMTIDNIRLYDISSRGLFSQAEIQQLYNEVQ